jgi:energy-coupling factor transporter ATP-binding protein EcfA2
MTMLASVTITNPYPGLRAFETEESALFHGRKEHSEELVRLLSEQRLLAVVGSSGSGKSSLVKAGLLPHLQRGYLLGATTRWRTAILRPGAHPLTALAQALCVPGGLLLGDHGDNALADLEASSLGLVGLVREAELPDGESLLIVVDQFEEVFRFQRETRAADDGREVARFVESLLVAVQFELPVYIVLTMRSDFLGDCAQFPGLPEALNRAQYLIPRLTRWQREEAIALPLDSVGADISPPLVQRLLNDAGDSPDQLPALQHSLMQLYEAWKRGGAAGPLDLALYTREREIGVSVDSHATALFTALSSEEQTVAARLFRCLTTTEDGRTIRRATRLDRVFAVLGAAADSDRQRIRDVIRVYAARENSLLVCSGGARLADEDMVDITHETLIRQWSLLAEWVKQEAESADWLARLVRSAELKREGQAGYWGNPEAEFAWKLMTGDGWNAAWANQYGGDFEEGRAFLASSRDRVERAAREEEERRGRELETARALSEAERRRAEALAQQAVVERRGRIRLTWAVGALVAALVGLIWVAWGLQRSVTLANELRGNAKVAETKAQAAEARAQATALQLESEKATGADRQRLIKQVAELERRAQGLETKASRAEGLQSASDAAVKQIQELQAQLGTAREGRLIAEREKAAAESKQRDAERQRAEMEKQRGDAEKLRADLDKQSKELDSVRRALGAAEALAKAATADQQQVGELRTELERREAELRRVNATLTTVPAMVGLLPAQAEARLKEAALVVGKIESRPAKSGDGRILEHIPPEGTRVTRGSPVNLVVEHTSAGSTPLRSLPPKQ